MLFWHSHLDIMGRGHMCVRTRPDVHKFENFSKVDNKKITEISNAFEIVSLSLVKVNRSSFFSFTRQVRAQLERDVSDY